MLGLIHHCVFYPRVTLVAVSQSNESSSLLKMHSPSTHTSLSLPNRRGLAELSWMLRKI